MKTINATSNGKNKINDNEKQIEELNKEKIKKLKYIKEWEKNIDEQKSVLKYSNKID